MIKPWLVLDQRWIFRDKWYRLLLEMVYLDGGETIEEYYVGVFNNVSMILAVTRDREIVFVQQYKHGAQRVLIELPGGYVEDEEHILDAAKRELLEETGYEGGDWRHLGTFHSNPTKERGNDVHIFLVTDARCTNEPHLDTTETIEILKVDVGEAYSPAFLSNIQVLGTRLALELARDELLGRQG